MSFESKVEAAVSSLVDGQFAVDKYTGTADTWLVLNYQDILRVFAESGPHEGLQVAQLHLFMPYGDNPKALKRQITKALCGAGFPVSAVVNATDASGYHYVFEFQGNEHDLLDPEPPPPPPPPASEDNEDGGT